MILENITMLNQLKSQARALKMELLALTIAYRDPQTPWYARLWLAIVLAYAFSPIDLIPDFIPVLGYLDDLVLVPLGIALALRMMPPGVMESARLAAQQQQGGKKPVSLVGAAVILLLWLAALGWGIHLFIG